VRRPGTSAALIARFPACTGCSSTSGTSTSCRRAVRPPDAWFGRWAQSFFERVVVQGTIVGGATGLVRAGSVAVRRAQSGLLRGYVALLILGMTGLALYFLLQS